MRSSTSYRLWAPSLALLAGLTGLVGCAGQAPLSPALASTQDRNAVPAHRNQAKSWMKAGLATQKLLYVSDVLAGVVNVYTYPGLTFAGQLTGFTSPTGECTDRAGNIWIVDQSAVVYEYAHGGTSPINTLTSGLQQPEGCAINLKTGDLAVANYGSDQVLVFHNAAGTPATYSDPNFAHTFFLGYDHQGNLFVDGQDGMSAFHYAELPAGGSTFTDITLSTPPLAPGNIEWDGTDMAVGDQSSTIYRTQGSNVVGTVTLSTLCLGIFYIEPSHLKVIVPDPCSVDVDTYLYPAGGSPIKTITGGLQHPSGVVISR